MSERNHDNTGVGERRQFTFIEILMKEGLFRLGEKTFPTFAGYLDDFQVIWEAEPKHTDIPPHWKYRFLVEAKDMDAPPPKDGEPPAVKQYAITLCSHWGSPVISDMLNQLAGALPTDWDRGIKFNLWMPEKKTSTGRSIVKGKLRDLKDKELPTKFVWNAETNKGYIGVPNPIELANGKLDYDIVSTFYLAIANECAAYFGHAVATKDAKPATATAQTSTNPPATTTQAGSNIVALALGFVAEKFPASAGDLEALKSIVAEAVRKMVNKAASAEDRLNFISIMNTDHAPLLAGSRFLSDGNWQSAAPPVATGNIDDLPF